MKPKSSMFSLLIRVILFLSVCSTYQVIVFATTNDITQATPKREAFEIIIGGGIIIGPTPSPECPPPPPPPCPPPPPPPPPPPGPSRVEIATKVIQQFIKRIDCDKCGLKMSKGTPKFCASPKFGCAFLDKYKQQALYAIQFNECNIKGKNITLEDFIDKLPDLSIFHANSNNFGGKVPVLSKLPYLFELDLSNNKYTGKFPVNVLGATKLTFLDLRFNSFEGPIPSQLFDLQEVLALFINNNKFEQDLPLNLGSTPAAFLTLANNYFTGPIPSSIGQASKTLIEVLFLNNKLTGCLPIEIGLLKKTRVFDVSINLLTGPIPRSFACLEKIEYLVLAQNQFYGPVPEEVCKLPHLTKLDLHGNYFTQVGPECMKLMRKGVLDVRDNCVLGLPDQKSAYTCEWFFKQPKPCGDSKVFNYMPCKKSAPYLNSEVSLDVVPQSQPPVTYGYLTPNNN